MTSRYLPVALLWAACLTPQIAASATVFKCLDANGRRVGWADTASQCPTGSAAHAYSPPDLCVIPGACATVAPPPGVEPFEFVCCAFVSGDSACHYVAQAVECPPDQFLASCDWGETNVLGDVTCYD